MPSDASPTEVELYHVDAFTDTAFGGNPAAVCLLDGPVAERWMADVAAELNLAETAFTWPEGDHRRLRWFTPTIEVDLCGHATLATAHVLWRERGVADRTLRFTSASGELTVTSDGARVRLDFPVAGRTDAPAAVVDDAAAALGATVTGAARYGPNLLVEVADAETLRKLRPDVGAVADLDVQGVIVTSPGDGFDYLVRYFAPRAGIPEDHVTGSAQCAAGPWWAAKTGRRTFAVQQASARTGRLWVEVGDERVGIAGHAVTVLRGRLVV
jgi:PhzF family phenazine biosynthesis protein